MLSITGLVLFLLVLGVQCVGIASVIAARLAERSWARSLFQHVFFLSLALVGLATMMSVYLDSANWLPCAATLGVMSVGATLDFRTSRRTVYY